MTCHRLFLTLVLVCATVHASAQSKVLFLGNSITKHGPKADIDWSGNWGMAAGAEANDYVHLVTKTLTEKAGAAPEVMVKNIADFERAYAGYDVAAKLKDAVDFHADLIILAISENVRELKTAENPVSFQQKQKRDAGLPRLNTSASRRSRRAYLVSARCISVLPRARR